MATKIVTTVITKDDTVLLVHHRRPQDDLKWVFLGRRPPGAAWLVLPLSS